MRAQVALTSVLSLAVAAVCVAQAPSSPPCDRWAGWRFLEGDWVGEGSGEPGKGAGWFSFAFDLAGKVLIRRNHSEYPAAGEAAATVHDDLMIVYPAPADGGFAAVYFDNEGHVIHYTAAVAAGGAVILMSAPTPSAPGYRLTYGKLAGDALAITFEVAAPGAAGAFKTYLAGRALRKTGR